MEASHADLVSCKASARQALPQMRGEEVDLRLLQEGVMIAGDLQHLDGALGEGAPTQVQRRRRGGTGLGRGDGPGRDDGPGRGEGAGRWEDSGSWEGAGRGDGAGRGGTDRLEEGQRDRAGASRVALQAVIVGLEDGEAAGQLGGVEAERDAQPLGFGRQRGEGLRGREAGEVDRRGGAARTVSRPPIMLLMH